MEVLVIIALASFLILCALIVLPKGRETARTANCQRNLMQLGMATLHYEQVQRHYPTSPPLAGPVVGDNPVAALLDTFLIPDFLDFRDADHAPKASSAPGRGGRVAGLICPSDPQAMARPGVISYRANAGDDPDGRTGPFAPGVAVGAATVEAADGLSYTAGFAERLVGTGRDGEPDAANYALLPGQVTAPCGPFGPGDRRWRGDAGSSWAEPGWKSALYSHAVPPGVATSCIAEDGRTAAITAASAHPGRVNVWMLDGSVRAVTPNIHPPVWRAMGSLGSAQAPGEPSP